VELILPFIALEDGHSNEDLRKAYVNSLEDIDYISNVQVLFV